MPWVPINWIPECQWKLACLSNGELNTLLKMIHCPQRPRKFKIVCTLLTWWCIRVVFLHKTWMYCKTSMTPCLLPVILYIDIISRRAKSIKVLTMWISSIQINQMIETVISIPFSIVYWVATIKPFNLKHESNRWAFVIVSLLSERSLHQLAAWRRYPYCHFPSLTTLHQ